MILRKEFYNQNTLKIAQKLLGSFLIRKFEDGKIFKYIITETEAYCGPNDLASHACKGRTPRTEIMFGEPGIIYVYLVYGMHYMLNVVTERSGYPAAVLIRAVESPDNFIIDGPGKLTKLLKIDNNFNALPIYTKKHGLWIEKGELIKPSQIKKAPRVGVDYAGSIKISYGDFFIKNKCKKTLKQKKLNKIFKFSKNKNGACLIFFTAHYLLKRRADQFDRPRREVVEGVMGSPRCVRFRDRIPYNSSYLETYRLFGFNADLLVLDAVWREKIRPPHHKAQRVSLFFAQ
jgi:DNA-3-methyladenine glycosylase